MIVRVHVFVKGRVQGVSFRFATLTRARERRINGWVRNLSDGRLEATFEGEQEKVEEMIGFCRKGPAGALVMDVQVLWEKDLEDYKSFEIHY